MLYVIILCNTLKEPLCENVITMILVVEWCSPPAHVRRAHYFTLLCQENYQYFHLLSTNLLFLTLFYTIQFINWHINVAFSIKWRARRTWAGGEHHCTTSIDLDYSLNLFHTVLAVFWRFGIVCVSCLFIEVRLSEAARHLTCTHIHPPSSGF